MQRTLISLAAFLAAAISVSAQNLSENERLRMENRHLRQELDSLRREVKQLKGVTVINLWDNISGIDDDEAWNVDNSGFGLSGRRVETSWARSVTASVPSLGLSYDDILKKYVDFYSVSKAKQMASILGRYEKYLPTFRGIFARYGVPEDLVALCIVESAVSRKALSSANALGMWQLMPGTAREYGLRVDGTVDERLDIEKSTDAAARLLRDLRRSLGSWALAVAAYNCGSGGVRKAIVKSGGSRDIWVLSEYLPGETQAYIPSLVAARYTWLHAEELGIVPRRLPADRFDVAVVQQDTSFGDLAEFYDLTVSSLANLNPQFKTGDVPKGSTVTLPYGTLVRKK